jgi:hypothetical protein
MANTLELLSGVLRYFPNTMMVTLAVGGVALGRIAWILISLGAMILSAAILTIQYLFSKGIGLQPMPGAAVLDACALIPNITNGQYYTTPSLWMALTAFFAAFTLTNAAYIYSSNPAKQVKSTIPVQQRKGLGLISILATTLLALFLIIPRAVSPCESGGGAFLGFALGSGFGYLWWKILDGCGSDVLPDIHGVLASLSRGKLHNAPRACVPPDALG